MSSLSNLQSKNMSKKSIIVEQRIPERRMYKDQIGGSRDTLRSKHSGVSSRPISRLEKLEEGDEGEGIPRIETQNALYIIEEIQNEEIMAIASTKTDTRLPMKSALKLIKAKDKIPEKEESFRSVGDLNNNLVDQIKIVENVNVNVNENVNEDLTNKFREDIEEFKDFHTFEVEGDDVGSGGVPEVEGIDSYSDGTFIILILNLIY